MNEFSKWLLRSGLTGVQAARIFGVTPAQIWQYSRDDWWPSERRIALRIVRMTGGAVRPNDLLHESLATSKKSAEYRATQAILGAKAGREDNGRSHGKKGTRAAKGVGQKAQP